MRLWNKPKVTQQWVVQLTVPVDNPENNVRATCRKGVYIFEIPINHPLAHTIGLDDLVDAVNQRELLDLSTSLNNTVFTLSERSNINATDAPKAERQSPQGEARAPESVCRRATASGPPGVRFEKRNGGGG